MSENKFHYVYSAPTAEERKEIDSIKREYEQGRGESKMEGLRRLHARVKRLPTALALALGIGGCLLFGLGLTLVLEWGKTPAGVLVGVAGCLPMAAAYPLYKQLIKRNKQKYGGEILRLSEELLKGEK